MSNEAIERRLDELRKIAARYATYKAEAEYLEHFRKSKHALLMREAELKGVKTAAGQERDAYAHPDYQELLMGYKVAIERSEQARWELEIARMGVELWRTTQANKRVEAKAYGL